MRVLVACEYSGIVRDAFRALGHDAWSCDLLSPVAGSGSAYHIQGDVLEVVDDDWDLMVAHPPCTDLAVSGARWFPAKIADGRQGKALDFVQSLMDAPIHKIAIENPVSVISTHIRKPDQIIQPYEFGDPYRKTTCLWLKNLPTLVPTDRVEPLLKTYTRKDGRTTTFSADYGEGWSKTAGHRRSATYPGIAAAIASQWGVDD